MAQTTESAISKTDESSSHFALIGSVVIKRLFDIVSSLIGLILLSPLFLLIAFWIKRESPGPVFYEGLRTGRHGRVFKMLKFRTIYETERRYEGPLIAYMDDDRITPLGKWLRDTKLDELPQLWNVLIGDMSWVGPRPQDPWNARAMREDTRREILSVRPGITSPASVVYRDEDSMLHAGDVMRKYLHELSPDETRLDQLYVRYRSFWLDIDVMLWTTLLLIPRIRAYSPPEQLLFTGLVTRLIQRYVNWFVWDFLISLAALAIASAFWRLSNPIDLIWSQALVYALVSALLFNLVNYWMELGQVRWHSASPELVFELAFSSIISMLLVAMLDGFRPDNHHIPLGLIVVWGLLAFLGFVSIRYRQHLIDGLTSQWLNWREDKRVRERVLIVGSEEGSSIANALLNQGESSHILSVVGIVDDERLDMQGTRVMGQPLLGGIAALPQLIARYDVGVVLFAVPNATAETRDRVREYCSSLNVRMVDVADLQDALTQPEAAETDSYRKIIDKISKQRFTLSIAYPKLLSKRFESPFLVDIYFEEMKADVKTRINEIIGEYFNERIYDTNLKLGQTLKIRLFSPDIVFQEPIAKKLDLFHNSVTFLGKPLDTCQPGEHKVVLSIMDNETGTEWQSETITVRVVDFAFDHISRPLVSRFSAFALGIGSFAMFVLTFLEEIDKTFGYTSGTAAGILSLIIAVGFHNLYQRIRPSTP